MAMYTTTRKGFLTLTTSLAALLAGCGTQQADSSSQSSQAEDVQKAQSGARETIMDDSNGGHAIVVSAQTAEYVSADITKTGDDEGDEADFYGTNAAVYAENGATLSLDDVTVTTNGGHANAVFSYGEGTSINIKNSAIETSANCSGGIMVTGGGRLEATDLKVHTTGNSSAPIRSDRGGGVQVVTGGSYQSEGVGSPVIYSTADVHVIDAALESKSSQGVVVEGKNSVTLTNCDLVANNTSKNSDKSDWYQAVMIYQSMSGDAAEGKATFAAEGGSITNANGDVFFANNTVCDVNLSGVTITNQDANGVLLRAAAAGWGNEGSNGGQVTMNVAKQELVGTMLVDEVSNLNLCLSDGSTFVGAVNPDAASGEVYVRVDEGCAWELSADAHISSLTCTPDGIKLNGFVLTVGDAAYVEGTASEGTAIEPKVRESSNGPGGGAEPPSKPGNGEGGGEPPAKPEGGEPPAKPGSDKSAASTDKS